MSHDLASYGFVLKLSKQVPAKLEVYRPPVVRIHEAVVPDLASLEDIRNPRAGEFEQGLGQ